MTPNNPFTVYARDCTAPADGEDALWTGGPGVFGMTPAPPAGAITLTGGNIVVPHRAAR